MFKLFKRIGLLLDFIELLIVRALKNESEQQEQKSAALTREIEDAEAYRGHVIEEIVKARVAIGCLTDEAIPESARRLKECPYDELKRLHWDYKLRTVMMDKHGTA